MPAIGINSINAKT